MDIKFCENCKYKRDYRHAEDTVCIFQMVMKELPCEISKMKKCPKKMKRIFFTLILLFCFTDAFAFDLPVEVHWDHPGYRTDGTRCRNLASNKVYRVDGTRTLVCTTQYPVDRCAFTVTVTDHSCGQTCFVATAIDANSNESPDSNIVCKGYHW